VRYFRCDGLVTGWRVCSDRPGRLRVKNPALFRKSPLCHAIERELMGVLGIDHFSTNAITCTVKVDYDPRHLSATQVVEILDAALAGAESPAGLDKLDLHLPICTASLPLAATAQFAAPATLPVAAVLYAYTSIPTLKEARRVLLEERRIGVDALDAVVMVGCLGTMSIFPGAVCCWCLSFGRFLVKQSRDRSRKMLLNAFGKQPRHAWLCRDAAEVQVPVDKLQKGDVIIVHTGEAVPVDGHVVEGMAMVDQHALTGESTPAEKGVGDRVFASTLVVAGQVRVLVETSGSETASARIAGGRSGPGPRRDIRERDGLGADRAGARRHGRLHDGVTTQGGTAGRQGGDPDPGHGGRRDGHDGADRGGRGAQQRPWYGHPNGRAAGHAQLAGPLRQQGHPGQGRPGAGTDEPGRHRPVRQDRHPDPRAPRGRPRLRL
jgi:hypothetical protein